MHKYLFNFGNFLEYENTFFTYSFKKGGYTITTTCLPINNASPPPTIIPDKQISFSLNVTMYQASHGNEIKGIFGQYLWVLISTVTAKTVILQWAAYPKKPEFYGGFLMSSGHMIFLGIRARLWPLGAPKLMNLWGPPQTEPPSNLPMPVLNIFYSGALYSK